ncbi:MAG: HAD hydrolase family protein [Clostridiales bacterium]|nr:HAD hydrolase family protein [Clostridiales bacterium]
MNKYKLIAMDLDGTLTQHKSKLNEKNTQLLDRLFERYECIMVGAGSCRRIYEQMNLYPITIIGNYGMQLSKVINGEFTIIRSDSYTVDKDFFESTVQRLRIMTGYTKYYGDSVEFHPSGAVTFPLIGTSAPLSEKLSFDPGGEKRSKIYDLVSSAFSEYNCFIGGSSSFDIVKKQYDKYLALMRYANECGIDKQEILFIGDDFKRGGNDEQIKLGGIDYIEIKDYRSITQVLENNKIL